MEIEIPLEEDITMTPNISSFKEDTKNRKKKRVTESPVVKKLFNIPITITAQELLECSPQV